jgi:hypothetical protein
MERRQDDTTLLTLLGMVAATLMIAEHIAGKATRDTLFLVAFDVADLPKMMMASAVVSVVAVLGMSRLLARFGPARLVPGLYLASAVLLVLQWALAGSQPRVAAVALYVHVAALNSILISGFWSLINERFDPYSMKRAIARLSAAATFGGLIGGLAAGGLAALTSTNANLLMLAGMHLACAVTVGLIGRGQARVAPAEGPPANLLAPLQRSPMIRRMAVLALLAATTAAVLDYILKAEASAALTHDELITFFSYFYTAVGLGTFLVQAAVGNRALRWLGIGGTMVAWPLAIATTALGALFVRTLAAVTLMRASANLLYNSFFRAGFEVLYTPVPPADKRTGKVLIDVGADRLGDLVGGLVISGLLLVPFGGEGLLLVTAIVLALACAALILFLHRNYVGQLADNLRAGTLRPDEVPAVDATTAHTLAATLATTQAAIDREQLLQQINAARAARPAAAEASPVVPRTPGIDAVAEAIIDLRSGDEARIRRVLASHAMTPELLPHAIPLLRDERVLREALRAVRRVATSAAGQLVDALTDPLQAPLVKRRLPLVLAHSSSTLAVQGLTVALDDPDWNTRFRCAEALAAIHGRDPALKLDGERLLQVVEREAHALGSVSAADDAAQGRQIQFILLLLGALYDSKTLELCYLGLRSEDRGLRGTALEYLENLLPPPTWAVLRKALGPGPGGGHSGRSLQQMARDLLQAASLRPKAATSEDAALLDTAPLPGGDTAPGKGGET